MSTPPAPRADLSSKAKQNEIIDLVSPPASPGQPTTTEESAPHFSVMEPSTTITTTVPVVPSASLDNSIAGKGQDTTMPKENLPAQGTVEGSFANGNKKTLAHAGTEGSQIPKTTTSTTAPTKIAGVGRGLGHPSSSTTANASTAANPSQAPNPSHPTTTVVQVTGAADEVIASEKNDKAGEEKGEDFGKSKGKGKEQEIVDIETADGDPAAAAGYPGGTLTVARTGAPASSQVLTGCDNRNFSSSSNTHLLSDNKNTPNPSDKTTPLAVTAKPTKVNRQISFGNGVTVDAHGGIGGASAPSNRPSTSEAKKNATGAGMPKEDVRQGEEVEVDVGGSVGARKRKEMEGDGEGTMVAGAVAGVSIGAGPEGNAQQNNKKAKTTNAATVTSDEQGSAAFVRPPLDQTASTTGKRVRSKPKKKPAPKMSSNAIAGVPVTARGNKAIKRKTVEEGTDVEHIGEVAEEEQGAVGEEIPIPGEAAPAGPASKKAKVVKTSNVFAGNRPSPLIRLVGKTTGVDIHQVKSGLQTGFKFLMECVTPTEAVHILDGLAGFEVGYVKRSITDVFAEMANMKAMDGLFLVCPIVIALCVISQTPGYVAMDLERFFPGKVNQIPEISQACWSEVEKISLHVDDHVRNWKLSYQRKYGKGSYRREIGLPAVPVAPVLPPAYPFNVRAPIHASKSSNTQDLARQRVAAMERSSTVQDWRSAVSRANRAGPGPSSSAYGVRNAGKHNFGGM